MKTCARPHAFILAFLSLVAAAGCGMSEDPDGGTGGGAGATGASTGVGGGPDKTSLRMSGTVVDFQTSKPVMGSATVTTAGLNPLPAISISGADFTLKGIAAFSVFHILGGSPPTYRNTYAAAAKVDDHDVDGVLAPVVAEAFLTELTTTFAVSPSPGTGIVIVHAVDAAGSPVAGVPRSALALDGAAPPKTPYFLDANGQPSASLGATSASGYVVLFDVAPGVTALTAAMDSGYVIAAPASPVAANTVTLFDATVAAGSAPPPTNVSFSNDIVPIFTRRGCVNCHSGHSIGADQGDLSLNSGDNSVYKELTQEVSANFGSPRVNRATPEKSLVLTMPSFESPADPHPNVTFQGAADPDFVLLLAWIREGAKEN